MTIGGTLKMRDRKMQDWKMGKRHCMEHRVLLMYAQSCRMRLSSMFKRRCSCTSACLIVELTTIAAMSSNQAYTVQKAACATVSLYRTSIIRRCILTLALAHLFTNKLSILDCPAFTTLYIGPAFSTPACLTVPLFPVTHFQSSHCRCSVNIVFRFVTTHD